MTEVTDAESFACAVGATPAQMADLERYRALLEEWNERMNLVGPSAMAAFWPRHAYDSAQLLEVAGSFSPPSGGSTRAAGEEGSSAHRGRLQLEPSSGPSGHLLPEGEGKVPKVWADIGAGAGFPGVVLAILLKGREGVHVHLIESIAKRCRFLEAASGDLGLPVTVHNARAESLRLTGIEVVTARACAPMDKLLGYAQPILRKGARGLFLKGRDAEAELAAASKHWRFEAAMIPSKSDPSGRIVSIERLARA